MQTPEPEGGRGAYCCAPDPRGTTRPHHGGGGGPGDTRHGVQGGEGRRGPRPQRTRGAERPGGEACSSESPAPSSRKTWAPPRGRGGGRPLPACGPGGEPRALSAGSGHPTPSGNGSINYKVGGKGGGGAGQEQGSPPPVRSAWFGPGGVRAPPRVGADGPVRGARSPARGAGRDHRPGGGGQPSLPKALRSACGHLRGRQGGGWSRAGLGPRPHLEAGTSRSRSGPRRRLPGSSQKSGLEGERAAVQPPACSPDHPVTLRTPPQTLQISTPGVRPGTTLPEMATMP